MQFTINRESLLKSLQLASGVIERRQLMPILSHVLLKLTIEGLTIVGTDQDIVIEAKAQVNSLQKEGETTVPAQKLLFFFRYLPESSVIHCVQEGNYFILTSGNSRLALMTLPASDFPKLSFEAPLNFLEISNKQLKSLIEATRFAMAGQPIHYHFHGMLWEVQSDRFQVVAADGHRLAKSALSIQSANNFQMIVPKKTILELSRLLNETDQVIKLALTDRQLTLKAPEYGLSSRLIDGIFPDHTQFIPKKLEGEIMTVDRDHFRQALTRVSILLSDKHRGVRLELSQNNLKLLGYNVDQEEAEEQLLVSHAPSAYQGIFKIEFNIDYLIDVLEVMAPGVVQLVFNTSTKPTLLQHVEKEESVYIIMPMRPSEQA